MKTLRPSIVALATILCLSSARAGIDPTNARGFSPDKVYAVNGFDAVNTFNGNLTLNIPIGQEYQIGDGLKYQLHLTYNSTIWDQEELVQVQLSPWGGYIDPLQNIAGAGNNIESVPVRWSNAGLGWHVTFGELRRTEMESNKFRFSYVTPDGASHFFYDGLHKGAGDTSSDPTTSYTRDGTYIRMTKSSGGNVRTVELPDGTRNRFVCFNRCGSAPYEEFRLEEISDSRGNSLFITHGTDSDGNRTWRLTESNNPARYHLLTFEPSWLKYSQSGRPNEWRLKTADLAAPPDASGQARRAVYRFQYIKGRVHREGSQTIYWNNYDPAKSYVPWVKDNTIDSFGIEVDLLAAVEFPEPDASWAFDYYKNGEGEPEQFNTSQDSTGKHPWSDIAGRLSEVTLPTQGKVTYKYARRSFPKRNCNQPDPDPGIPSPPMKGRFSHNIGVWRREEGTAKTYYVSWVRDAFSGTGNPCETAKDLVAAVIDPMGVASLNYFSVALNEEEENSWKTYEYGMPFTRMTTEDGLFLSKQTYKCDASYMGTQPSYADARTLGRAILSPSPACGTAKRSTFVQYEYSEIICDGAYEGPDCIQSNQRVLRERTVFHDDPIGGVPTYTQTEHDDFDGLSRYRTEKKVSSFAAANFGTDTPQDATTTFADFNPAGGVIGAGNPWLLNTLDDEILYDASNVAQKRTLYQYDASGIPQARRTLADPTKTAAVPYKLSTNDFLVTYVRTAPVDDVITLTERYFGGDKHSDKPGNDLGVSAPFNPGSAAEQQRIFRTFQYGGEKSSEYRDSAGSRVLLIEANTIDPSSGLVTTSADASDAKTVITYDTIGRLSTIKPEGQDSIGYSYASLADGASTLR